ncbi:MAG: glycosyltransferase, partial [Spirochaetaceae bacterium]
MYRWELLLLVSIAGLNVILLLRLLVLRLLLRGTERRRLWVRNFIRTSLSSAPVAEIVRALLRDTQAFMEEYALLVDSINVPEAQRTKIQDAIVDSGLFARLVRRLKSSAVMRRKTAAILLGYARPEHSAPPLMQALAVEKRSSVKLHIAYALSRTGNPVVIPSIVDSLADSDETYQRQIHGILSRFRDHLHSYFNVLRKRNEPEVQALVMNIAALRSDDEGRTFLETLTRSDIDAVAVEATRMLLQRYLHQTNIEQLLRSSVHMIQNLALEAVGDLPPEQSLAWLMDGLRREDTRKSAVIGLSRLVLSHPGLYMDLVQHALEEQDDGCRDALLEVLSKRVEYLIEKSLRDRPAREALRAVLQSGRVHGVLGFLSQNQDTDVERFVIDAIEAALQEQPDIQDLIVESAPDRVLETLSLDRSGRAAVRHTRVGESTPRWFVIGVIGLTVLVPVVVYTVLRWSAELSVMDHIRVYGLGFTLVFAWYAFALNIWYLVLTWIAGRSVRSQQRGFEIKPVSMLFAPGVLPSISVLAPAYNEEASIVESVRSLLGLRYPDFEVLVINDGSADGTLQRLIDVFELDRVDIFVHGYLPAQPVRGIYRNPRIPELTVIDKQSGGKADSLNVGINASRKAYFAAIDADSLLERDALLRATAQFLDSDVPVVATGGNIFPVNGCTVSDGVLEEIRLPQEHLGRFQVLEYLRSFMAGRTGWAGLKSLMIISGAFGVFRKADVIDAHGYMTGSGYFSKDTVAEDMELVVRITRSLTDRGEPHAVQYSYNANCWTEVPVSRRILRSQRDRWQRGLIDTMYY